MTTQRDIAKKIGVSSATVSRVLSNTDALVPISEKTREKILAVAKELGYRPNLFAKSLRTKKTNMIGVVIWELTDPFFSEILHGIDQVLDTAGYMTLLSNAEGRTSREKFCMEKMSNFRVDGMLIVGGAETLSEEELAELDLKTRSVVLVGTRSKRMDLSSVTVDNYKGGYIGAEYLIKHNRGRVFYISGIEKTLDMEDRLQGVKAAIGENGVGDRFDILEVHRGEHEGYLAARRVLQQVDTPIAIFAENDTTGLGIVRAVKDAQRRIPEDVAVVGFDDLSICDYMEPRLSTVHQPRAKMGRIGAEMLVENLNNLEEKPASACPKKILSPKLIIRESSLRLD
jgi:LacI family transcriptional regulator